jgi:hypothetical protein
LISLVRISIDSLFFILGLAYEYDHAEPGFSVPRPRVTGAYSQPPVEPPASDVDFTGLEADDMVSPHCSESFFHDGPTSPSILLVPIGDGDSFDVVLGPILTHVRSEEASLEQESPLAVEPVGDEPLLIEGGPSRVSSSPDGQPLVTTDDTVSSELTDIQVEDLTEQAAVGYDYELDESWLAEQLFDSLETEVPTSEGLAEAHASPGTFYFLCHLFIFYFSMYLCILFYFVAGSSAPAGPPEAADVPIPDPIPPVSGDEAIGWVFSSFISSLIVTIRLTHLLCRRCFTEGFEARPGRVGGFTSGHLLRKLPARF